MPARVSHVEEAARRAQRQLDEVVSELRSARMAAGLSQATVAHAAGCSQQLIAAFESRLVDPRLVQLARWGAVVGLDIPIRTFASGRRLRDAGQLRLLARFRESVGDLWTWHTEVPVGADPRDRRAIDAVLSRGDVRIGAEAIVRLTDSQSETRRIVLKLHASGLTRMVLVLAKTRHNALSLSGGAPTLLPAFPLSSRDTMRALRAGVAPEANGVVVL